ncbi:TolC family protein [Noviherbaspirillum pedocola]|uniref:TolC family protein n=1 Tax=Noviherbaspirillum pedocola TaxID=2801341 RepID=A0A934SPE2_9BURK|nr:TolC family protein [Noviherbaspirillum pedocola]MBK4733024.1 TolC family protein [Noviherbaspirillum pedocola]
MFCSIKSLPAANSRKHYRFHLSALVALAIVPVFSLAESSGLTLDQAVQLGVQHSASSQAAAASVQASREMAVKADQLPAPMLKLGVDNLPVTGEEKYSLTRDFMTARRVGIEQQWVSSDKRIARAERGQRAVEAEEANYLANVADVRKETAVAWINVLFAQRSFELLKALENETRQDLTTGQAALRGAKTGAADVLQAQLALAQAQDRTRKGEQVLKSARTALFRWIAVPVEFVDGTLPPLTSHVVNLPVEELEKYHPMLLSAKRGVALADAETTVATTERQPDWSFEAAYAQRGSQYSNMVSVGVSIPLPVNRAQKQDRDIAEKSALGTKARMQYEDARRQLQAEIDDQALTLSSLQERVSQLKKEFLPTADQQVELATAAYRSGTGSLAAVFNAKRMSLDAQMQVLDVEKEAATTWAELEYHVVPHDQTAMRRVDQ